FGVAIVKVGLLGQEEMKVPLPRRFVPFPCRSAEHADPTVGWAIRRARLPDVPVAPRVRAGGRRFQKPRMPVRGVVRNDVEDDSDAAAARLAHEPIERREVAELRMHVAIVADVVAPVLERRRIDGAKPDRVDPKRPIGAVIEIVEVFDDAVEVPDSVSVRVGKAARVDLIEDRPAPPFVGHPVLRASAEYHNADSARVFNGRLTIGLPVDLRSPGAAPRDALWLYAVEAEIPEPAARLRGILRAHHQ